MSETRRSKHFGGALLACLTALLLWEFLAGGTFAGSLQVGLRVVTQLLTGWVVLACWRAAQKNPPAMPSERFGIPILLFTAAMVLTTPFSEYPRLSLEVLFQKLWYLLVFLLVALQVRGKREADQVAGALIVASTAVILIGFGQYLAVSCGPPRSQLYEVRIVTSTLNSHNDFAGFIALVFPFFLLPVLRGDCRPRALASAGLLSLIAFVCLLGTYSRGGWLGWMFGFLVLMIGALRLHAGRGTGGTNLRSEIGMPAIAGRPRSEVGRWVLPLFAVLLVCAGLGIGARNPWVMARAKNLFSTTDAGSQGRFTFWRGGLAMAREKPWSGWGLGTFGIYYPEHRPAAGLRELAFHCHNQYLQLLIETGIAGFLTFLWIWFAMLRTGWRNAGPSLLQKSPTRPSRYGDGARESGNATRGGDPPLALAATSGLAGFAFYSFFNTTWDIPAIWVAVAVVAALATCPFAEDTRLSPSRAAIRRGVRTPRKSVRWAGTVTGILFLLMALTWDIGQFHFERGIRLAKTGDTEHALQALESASRWDPGNTFYVLERMTLLAKAGVLVDRSQCLPLADLNGADALFIHNLGWLLRGDLDLFRRATAMDPTFYLYHLTLAYRLCENGDYKGALKQAETASELLPNNALVWWIRGMVEEKSGTHQRATESFSKCLGWLQGPPQHVPGAHVSLVYRRIGLEDDVVSRLPEVPGPEELSRKIAACKSRLNSP